MSGPRRTIGDCGIRHREARVVSGLAVDVPNGLISILDCSMPLIRRRPTKLASRRYHQRKNSALNASFSSAIDVNIFLRTAFYASRFPVSHPRSNHRIGALRLTAMAGLSSRLRPSHGLFILAFPIRRVVSPVSSLVVRLLVSTWRKFTSGTRCSQLLAAISLRRRPTPCKPYRRETWLIAFSITGR